MNPNRSAANARVDDQVRYDDIKFIYVNFLINEEQKYAINFSEKSGCTFVAKWFFDQIDLLDDALQYHPFVHRYRNDIYQMKDGHQRSLENLVINPSDYEILKVVRHPLKRAVSAFVHASFTGLGPNQRFNGQISHFLKRPINAVSKFSFREFVSFLESLDLMSADTHLRPQARSFEIDGSLVPSRIIDLEHTAEELSKFEQELNLKRTDKTKYRGSMHHTKRTETNEFCGDAIEHFGRDGVVTPEAISFFDDELLERVGKLYREDFARYGYSCSLDEIA